MTAVSIAAYIAAEQSASASAGGMLAAGEPSTLFYDPPWTIPFLRRNEVAVPVTGAAATLQGVYER